MTASRSMQIDIISIFPDMFAALEYGIVGRAIRNNHLQLSHWNPRDFTTDPHRTVDDRPYGGGPGMVMLYEPLHKTISAAKSASETPAKVIQLTPQGRLLDQAAIKGFAKQSRLILVSGRYEGIDERLVETDIDEQWSIGDYVVSGGELPAMILIDTITRLLPGALGDAKSAEQDSFSHGLLDHPHFTRPVEINGKDVPKVLQSGNHQAILRWRLKQALGKTWQKRPDLIKRRILSSEEQTLLNEYIQEHAEGNTHE